MDFSAISPGQIVLSRSTAINFVGCKNCWQILPTILIPISPQISGEYIIEEANKYLTKKFLPKGYSSNEWVIRNIDEKGNLRIFNETCKKTIKRF